MGPRLDLTLFLGQAAQAAPQFVETKVLEDRPGKSHVATWSGVYDPGFPSVLQAATPTGYKDRTPAASWRRIYKSPITNYLETVWQN